MAKLTASSISAATSASICFSRLGFGKVLLDQPRRVTFDGVALVHPALLLFLGAVVLAVDVAHVMAPIAIGIAEQESRAASLARSLHQPLGRRVDGAHVLPVHAFGVHAKGRRPGQKVAGKEFRTRGVLAVQIVLANDK